MVRNTVRAPLCIKERACAHTNTVYTRTHIHTHVPPGLNFKSDAHEHGSKYRHVFSCWLMSCIKCCFTNGKKPHVNTPNDTLSLCYSHQFWLFQHFFFYVFAVSLVRMTVLNVPVKLRVRVNKYATGWFSSKWGVTTRCFASLFYTLCTVYCQFTSLKWIIGF